MSKIFKLFYIFLILIVRLSYADLIENKDYNIINEEIPQIDPSKIEVLEFFGFFCVHCYHLQSFLSKEIRKFSDDTYIRRVHVVWSDSYLNFARLTYAVSKSGFEEKATNEIFKAIFEDNINLTVPDNLKAWLKNQKSWNTNALELAYNSKNSLLEADKMKQLTSKYSISRTPIIIVGGKYQLILDRDFKISMIKLEKLIDKVRQERNMKSENKNVFIPNEGHEITISALE